MSCLITMSQKELNRLEVIQKIRDRRLTVVQATALLDLSRSQIHRLLQAFDKFGAAGLVSGKRGHPSNRRYSEDFRNTVLDLIRAYYRDFGPTLACEKLVELHQLSVSKETLRQWMTAAGIWISRRERKKRVFQPRGRRDCFGELVQIDGSHHWWFEGRGPKCALLVYIDDATGKLLHLRFAGSENTFDYFHATKAYLEQWGKPLAFYSDKHGVFRSTHGSEKDRTSGLTQFGRALYELNIDIICANTPQAKGRVERANRTLQDRLVKELRLRGIDTMEAANAYAGEFIADGALCRKEVRTLSQSLTLRYDKVLFILEPTEIAKRLARQKVIVCDYPDGRLEIMHGTDTLPYRTFDKLRSVHRSPVVENKRLDDMLALVAEMQAGREQQRSKSGPRRTGQTDHMFGVRDGSTANGYQKRERKSRTAYMNDPAVIARREQALLRQPAQE